MRTRYKEIRSALEQVRVTARTDDRAIAVEMGPGGAVLGIELTDQAMQKSPQALAQALVETINSGMRQIADITNEVVAPFVSSANLDLQAITSGRLPGLAQERTTNPHAHEIEVASAIPKAPLGAYARGVQAQTPGFNRSPGFNEEEV